MGLHPLPHETIEGVAASLESNDSTCVDVLKRCLDRIEEWEGRVRAWVVVDREAAIRQAEACDLERADGAKRGPLHGIPFGIKDIIDVKGLPTSCGFGPYRQRVAETDADVVERLRRAGAVILGKTVTTQFAWIDPPPTRNPWNLDRTPGGSSSGSAVAVALGMCLGALGSQTGGSIIRPASYCGVVGYKPSSSSVSDRGLFPLAPTLDHPGVIAGTSKDAGIIAYTILDDAWKFSMEEAEATEFEPIPDNQASKTEETFALGEPITTAQPTDLDAIRLIRPRGFIDRRAEPEMLEQFEATLEQLQSEGAEVLSVDDSVFDFETLLANHRTIMAAEAAAVHEAEFVEDRDRYAPKIRSLIEEGLQTPVTRYIAASKHWQSASASLVNKLGAWFDTIVMPSATGPAPERSTTGDPAFNSIWSYLGWPCLTLPSSLSREGLPLGIQLIGQPFTGVPRLFRVAEWSEQVLHRSFRARSR